MPPKAGAGHGKPFACDLRIKGVWHRHYHDTRHDARVMAQSAVNIPGGTVDRAKLLVYREETDEYFQLGSWPRKNP